VQRSLGTDTAAASVTVKAMATEMGTTTALGNGSGRSNDNAQILSIEAWPPCRGVGMTG
jgi:hypothetical protein